MDTPTRTSGEDGMMDATVDVEMAHGLVSAAQRGSRPAVDRLVREHQGWVRGVIYGITGRRDLVDDVAQQVWTQVWQRLATLSDPRRLRAWLYSVARNAALDASQDGRRRSAVGLDAVADGLSDGEACGPVRSAVGDELREALLRAVEALPALYREPFVLRHLEDWSYAEIGELLGLSVETVETRLVRARRLLREMLKGKVEP
ncbi:MAG: RNA polymerase sigma factor [Phycisphaerae bacterium]